MHFLINPARGKSTKKRRRTRARATTVRRRRKTTTSKGGSVAKRRRRRRAVSKAVAPKRRRRRRTNPGALGRARANPARRRRRRRVARANPATRRRRRGGFRRNPGLSSVSGIVGNVVQGVKDGAAVVVGEIASRKVRGAITGVLPANVQAQVATGAGKIALSIAASLVVSLVARRAMPGQARLITAGAFAESINCALAATPVAKYLAAYPGTGTRRISGARLGAWTGAALPAGTARRTPVAAYPMRSVGMPIQVG